MSRVGSVDPESTTMISGTMVCCLIDSRHARSDFAELRVLTMTLAAGARIDTNDGALY